MTYWVDLARRGLRRSPRAIAIRLRSEVLAEAERFRAPLRARAFDEASLLSATECASLADLWRDLADRPHLARLPVEADELTRCCPDDEELILERARRAIGREVDLLGSGPVQLGPRIDWHRDAKSGVSWPLGYARRLRISNPNDASDVKFPWELSRLQWLLPVGQAYVLTRNAAYARFARVVLEEWIDGNPYAYSVNWSVAMEVAMRIFSWTWLFHVFNGSPEWSDQRFQVRFLSTLFLHAEYVERNLEHSDVNGNHFTANASGLTVAGLFFGSGQSAKGWARLGWDILRKEIDLQTHPDGVDFEASTAYHRLVMELFFLPALYRERLGHATDAAYRKRLEAMARFVAAYSQPDGSAPSWGDADDGRTLPFGTQAVGDHRYLVGLVGAHWNDPDLCEFSSGPVGEVFWTLGADATLRLSRSAGKRQLASTAFPHAGVYVMRSRSDHVFVDAGPVGMKGRGGHGHNDCLSFTATLDGVSLVVDPGSYVYTASYEWRNRFRSTAVHNTPVIDGAEQNRFIGPDFLWSLREDALPSVLSWGADSQDDFLHASHSGYSRAPIAVTPTRTIRLDRKHHWLCVHDSFRGEGRHHVRVALQLSQGLKAQQEATDLIRIEAKERTLALSWRSPADWSVDIADGWISPSYGVKVGAPRLEFTREGSLADLVVVIAPAAERVEAVRWGTSTANAAAPLLSVGQKTAPSLKP